MNLKYYQVDAFTSQQFKGNPAGVIFSDISDTVLMQKIAFENNLSEPAFISEIDNEFYIRWFTPYCEVDLCGHATLASAFIFFNYIDSNKDTFKANSKSGELRVTKNSSMYYLDFPIDELNEYKNMKLIEEVFNEKPEAILMGRHDILAIFKNENTIKNLKPNFSLMCDIDVRGFIASAEGNDVDFVSRCFFPITGINEDPVTGSAHTTLIPYWFNRLNKNNMMAKQLSERGGLLDCSIKDDRVFIGGQAVLYFSGTIEIKS